jgi:hypothetical protein
MIYYKIFFILIIIFLINYDGLARWWINIKNSA